MSNLLKRRLLKQQLKLYIKETKYGQEMQTEPQGPGVCTKYDQRWTFTNDTHKKLLDSRNDWQLSTDVATKVCDKT
jgi:hypothetical protein